MTRDLIVFAEDWGSLPSSTQHLVNHLRKTRKVVWINSIGLRRPTFQWRDLKRLWQKLTAANQYTKAHDNVSGNADFHIINPRTLPAPRSPLERKIASSLLSAQLRPVIKKAGLKSPILWTSLPTAVDMASELDVSTLVYYCGDNFSALAGVDHDAVTQHEIDLVNKADLIMTVSKSLMSRFPKARTKLIPHGVDFKLFTTATQRATDLPNDGRPIAGFYGSISEWLDIQLLNTVIKQLPQWHFVFIGKVAVDVSLLKQYPNVLFLGEKIHQQLPSYSQYWDASLLPFKDNAQIQACNPLKLREYLAAGRPIVSTPFPALAPYKDYIHQVNNADDMVIALQLSALQSSSKKQQYAVSGHTWSARAQQISTWLEQL